MGLSNDLISQFVKVTNDDKKDKKETVLYGTVSKNRNNVFVTIDGSDIQTPAMSTTDVKDGERVTVTIKNHTAIVTGNISSPSARTEDVQDVTSKVSDLMSINAASVTTDRLDAIWASIENLQVIFGKFDNIDAVYGEFEELKASYADITHITAKDMEVINASIDNLTAECANIDSITTEDLNAINAEINNIKGINAEFTYVSASILEAIKADIKTLNANKVSAENADIMYANIDFSNIGEAAIEKFFSKSGMIENVVVKDGSITGTLVGVTIKGDRIEGNTIVADKLVIQGDDGLYYKLNTSLYDVVYYRVDYNSETGEYTTSDEVIDVGDISVVENVTTTAGDAVYSFTDGNETIYCCKNFVYNNEKVDVQEVPKNSIDGKVIAAESITADKINVTDLVAFGATIGGFHIGSNSIYSGVKTSPNNSTRGIYLDTEGQMSIGDTANYIKYYKMDDGTYKLEISAESILFGGTTRSSLSDLVGVTEHVKIGTHEGKPCVELFEDDSGFKQRITNKNVVFMDGANAGTTIDTDSVTTENVITTGDLQHGDYVWAPRSNGNYGLIWKG